MERGTACIVDGDALRVAALCPPLKEAGWLVRTAGSAAAGGPLLREAPCDLLLLGLTLPDADARIFLQAVRRDGAERVPALLLAAREQVGEVAAALEAGGDDFLLTPCAPAELLARARAHLTVSRRTQELTARAQAWGQVGNLAALDALKDDLLATFAHELRTPLTAIKGALALVLEDSGGEAPQREFLELALQNTDRLIRTVGDLLDCSAIRAGGVLLTREPFPPLQAAAVSVAAVRGHAAAKRIALAQAVPADLPLCFGERGRVIQVLTNLLDNAVKFTPPGGRVAIRAAPRDGAGLPLVQFAVTDSGPGVPPEALPRLFAPFGQADMSSRRPAGGLGLGLMLCRAIVEAHGGQIWVESSPGTGSTFAFTIPQVAAAAVARGAGQVRR